ncbi:ArsR family transcriptional regulator [Bacillus solitudinis]|uniref:ArsR family transcriptional regulator n=1 Tax=Bacillus solitudinis TaxID=2014074 RepID=UPI0012FE6A8E|nr:ArsR family transcriptional regulator [Bacillus solitudinis]
MRLSNEEIIELRLLANKKELKNRDIASTINISQSAVSQFLRNKTRLSESNENKIKDIIQQADQFVMRRVRVSD